MQFILTGYDGTDADAQSRRMYVRDKHLDNARRLKEDGNLIWGGAILDDKGNMKGSAVVYDFDSREDLDKMLETEPYVLGRVWEKIEIKDFRLANI